jgi:hypothetical protein
MKYLAQGTVVVTVKLRDQWSLEPFFNKKGGVWE